MTSVLKIIKAFSKKIRRDFFLFGLFSFYSTFSDMLAESLLCFVLCVRLAASVKTAASPAGWLSYCSTSAAEQEEEIGKYQQCNLAALPFPSPPTLTVTTPNHPPV